MSLTPVVIDDPFKTKIAKLVSSEYSLSSRGDFYDALRMSSGKLDNEFIFEFIYWALNDRMEFFFIILLESDISLINQIFDPTATVVGNQITKAALQRIECMIEEEHDRTIFFAWAEILDIVSNEFLFKPSFGFRLSDCVEYVWDYLEANIAFRCIWKTVDDENASLVADYIWNHMFDLSEYVHQLGLLNSSECYALNIESEAHEKVFQIICSRAMEIIRNHSDTKPVREICTMFFFKPYSKKKQDFYEKALLAVFGDLLVLSYPSKNFKLLLEMLQEVFTDSTDEFRESVLETLKREVDQIPEEYDSFISFLIQSNFPSYNWDLMKLAASSQYDASNRPEWAKELADWFRSNIEISSLTRQQRRQILLFAIQLGLQSWFKEYVLEMKENHFLELRACEDEIKKHCLRYQENLYVYNDEDLFTIVTQILTTKSQPEFHEAFLKLLFNFSYVQHKGKDFARKAREHFRHNFAAEKAKWRADYFELGILTARYGEQQDLVAGLSDSHKYNCQNFLCGFLSTRNHQKIEITEAMHQRIYEILSKSLSDSLDPRDLDFLLAYIIRHNSLESTQKEIEIVEKNGPRIYQSALLEVVIKKREFTPDNFKLLIESQKSSYSRHNFKDFKYRIVEIWDCLDREIRQLFCDLHPIFNIYALSPRDPKFVTEVMELFQGEDVINACQRSIQDNFCCVSRAQLTAHWFFVDEEEIDIEVCGYLGMVEIAF
jgi:hypothetical protein